MKTTENTMPNLCLRLRASPDSRPHLYVVADGVEYMIGGVIDIDVHKINRGCLLTAGITALIEKLG